MTDREPIMSPADMPPAPERPFERSSLIAMIAGALIVAISVITAVGYALLPLIDGQGWAEFFNFLIVPTAVGIMGVIPGLLLFFTGRHVRKHASGIGVGCVVIVLAIPPLAFVGLLRSQGFSAFFQSLALLIIGLSLLIWGLSLIRAARRLRP